MTDWGLPPLSPLTSSLLLTKQTHRLWHKSETHKRCVCFYLQVRPKALRCDKFGPQSMSNTRCHRYQHQSH